MIPVKKLKVYRFLDEQIALRMFDNAASCGTPQEPGDISQLGFEFFKYFGIQRGDTYLIKAEGDSMYPRIWDGDMLVVDSSREPQNGNTVVALIDGDKVVIKKYKHDKRRHVIQLSPLNENYHVIEEKDTSPRIEIQGVVMVNMGDNYNPRRLKKYMWAGDDLNIKGKETGGNDGFARFILKDKDTTLAKLHKFIDGKKGKQLALVIKAAIEAGLISLPEFPAMEQEFGNLGSRQAYSRYFNSNMISKEEIEAVKKALEG